MTTFLTLWAFCSVAAVYYNRKVNPFIPGLIAISPISILLISFVAMAYLIIFINDNLNVRKFFAAPRNPLRLCSMKVKKSIAWLSGHKVGVYKFHPYKFKKGDKILTPDGVKVFSSYVNEGLCHYYYTEDGKCYELSDIFYA